jgi:Ca2+-binding RTX toxin-like protein
MNDCSVDNGGVRLTGISAAMLVATLAALPAVFALAKPSEAADPILTADPSEVGFGEVQVNTTDQRTVTVTNTSGTAVTIGAIRFIDPVTGDELVAGPFSLANPLPVGGLTVDPNSSSPLDLDISFSPTAGTGETSEAVLVFIEKRVDGTLGDAIGFVDETGRTVQGIDVSGTGVDQVNPDARARGCTVIGTRRGEALTGTPGNDVICALAGNDRVRPLGGKDVTRAGSGNDRVIDRSGLRDKLLGNDGRDRLNAKDRNRDLLIGASGRDTCAKNRGDKVRSC